MAQTRRSPADEPPQPPGTAAEGMDPYPTYRDGPIPAHTATTTKPTDVDLPRAKRTYAVPIFIGLVIFALIILARVFWSGINTARTTEEAVTPPPASTSAPAEDRAPAQ